MAKDHYVPFRVDDELKAHLDNESTRTKTSISETVRSILRAFFKKGAK